MLFYVCEFNKDIKLGECIMSKIISSDVKQQMREFYQSRPMTHKEVADKFGYCLPTVAKILNGLPQYTKSNIFNPSLDEAFFEVINTEDKAYYLGLLITDGNVFKANEHRASISITLDQRDAYLLTHWKECIRSKTNLGHDGRGCVQYAVRSLKMANDLAKYGVVPRKTLCSYLPEIEDKSQLRHLIRGLIDGDGGIYAHMHNNKFSHQIKLCGTERLMYDVLECIDSELHLKYKPKVYTYRNRPLSMLQISNIQDMNKLGHWLYNDASVYMDRKYRKFLDFQKHYGLANTEVSRQITKG